MTEDLPDRYSETPPPGTTVYLRIDTDGFLDEDDEPTSTAIVIVKMVGENKKNGLGYIDPHYVWVGSGCTSAIHKLNGEVLHRTQLDAIRAGVKADRSYNASMEAKADAVAEMFNIEKETP